MRGLLSSISRNDEFLLIIDIINSDNKYTDKLLILCINKTKAFVNIRTIDGIDLLNNLFFQDRLFIHESLGDSFIEELESYHRKRDKNDNILNAVADGQVDHRVDSLRYAIATLYKGSKNRY